MARQLLSSLAPLYSPTGVAIVWWPVSVSAAFDCMHSLYRPMFAVFSPMFPNRRAYCRLSTDAYSQVQSEFCARIRCTTLLAGTLFQHLFNSFDFASTHWNVPTYLFRILITQQIAGEKNNKCQMQYVLFVNKRAYHKKATQSNCHPLQFMPVEFYSCKSPQTTFVQFVFTIQPVGCSTLETNGNSVF